MTEIVGQMDQPLERIVEVKSVTTPQPKKIFWGAIYAGVVISLVAQLLFSLLGLGIGFGMIDLQESGAPSMGLGIGAGFWWVGASILSLFVAGWTAARLAGVRRPIEGMMHGLITWGFVTLVTVFLTGTAIGGLVTGAFGVVGQTVSVAGQTLSDSVPEIVSQIQVRDSTIRTLKNEARQLLRQTDKAALAPSALESKVGSVLSSSDQAVEAALVNPGETEREVDSLFERWASAGDGVIEALDKEALANVISARTDRSQAAAMAIVDRWESQFRQAIQQAKQTKNQITSTLVTAGDTVLAGLSAASLWAFFALVLGGCAAAAGGRVGLQESSDRPV